MLYSLIDAITCPITLEIFNEPVILPDGNTYEKNAVINLSRFDEKYYLINDVYGYNKHDLIKTNHSIKSLINLLCEMNYLIKQKYNIIFNKHYTCKSIIIDNFLIVDDKIIDNLIINVINNKISIYYFFVKYGKNNNMVKKLIDSTNDLKKTYDYIYPSNYLSMTKYDDYTYENCGVIKKIKLIDLILRYSTFKMIKYIAKLGAKLGVDLEFRNVYGNELIQLILSKNNEFTLDEIKYIVNLGADLNSIQDTYGIRNKPIHVVCENSNSSDELIKYFVDLGVNLESTDSQGNKPIHLICKKENLSIDLIKYFVDSGVNLESIDGEGNKPIHLICKNKNLSIDLIKYFIDLGIDLKSTDGQGNKPIHLICKNSNSSDDLIKYFVDLETPDKDGNKPIHLICIYHPKSNDLIKYIIDLGVDLNSENKQKQKPIHIISDKFTSTFDLLQNFIDKTDDLESENIHGHKPIYLICNNYSLKRDVARVNNIKLDIVHKIKNSNCKQLLLSGLNTNNMNSFIAKHSNNDDLIKKLIDYNENFDKVYENEYQLIHYICKFCDLEVIKYMIRTKGININQFIEEEKINQNNFNYFYFRTYKLNKLSSILRKRNFLNLI